MAINKIHVCDHNMVHHNFLQQGSQTNNQESYMLLTWKRQYHNPMAPLPGDYHAGLIVILRSQSVTAIHTAYFLTLQCLLVVRKLAYDISQQSWCHNLLKVEYYVWLAAWENQSHGPN
jgi:hypothetical protein